MSTSCRHYINTLPRQTEPSLNQDNSKHKYSNRRSLTKDLEACKEQNDEIETYNSYRTSNYSRCRSASDFRILQPRAILPQQIINMMTESPTAHFPLGQQDDLSLIRVETVALI